MKLVLRIVSLSAIVLLLPVVKSYQNLCFESVKWNSTEMIEIASRVVPESRAGKCLYECMLRNSRVVTEDGLIDVQKFMNSYKSIIQTGNEEANEMLATLETILEKCNGDTFLSEDKCETTALLLDCAVQEAETFGWQEGNMLMMLRTPYFFESSRA